MDELPFADKVLGLKLGFSVSRKVKEEKTGLYLLLVLSVKRVINGVNANQF